MHSFIPSLCRLTAVGIAALAASCGGDHNDDQTAAAAGITWIDITSSTTAFEGKTFGSVGAYQKLQGKAYGELDPKDPSTSTCSSRWISARGITNCSSR